MELAGHRVLVGLVPRIQGHSFEGASDPLFQRTRILTRIGSVPLNDSSELRDGSFGLVDSRGEQLLLVSQVLRHLRVEIVPGE